MLFLCFLVLVVIAIVALLENNFTRYRILEVNNGFKVKYRLQQSFLYIFWMNIEYSISPYSERFLEYDDLSEAIKKLNYLKNKTKISTRVVKSNYS